MAYQAIHERSEEHTSELQSQSNLVCPPLLAKKNTPTAPPTPTRHTPATATAPPRPPAPQPAAHARANAHAGSNPAAYTHSTSLFFNDTATTEIYTLSLHDALPISLVADFVEDVVEVVDRLDDFSDVSLRSEEHTSELQSQSNLVCRLLLDIKNKPLSQATSSPPGSATRLPIYTLNSA